jgi:hypothetical protein
VIANSKDQETVMKCHIVLAALFIATTQAAAVDDRVEAACERDYSKYCSQHDPEGADVRRCMRANGSKLTGPCVEALMAAGELTSDEVARYQQSKRPRR